jgi:hypothetical protein
MLQLALKTLADKSRSNTATRPNAASAVVGRSFQPTSASSGAARQFVEYLAARVPQTVLRYSERLEIIRTARRFGIGRFEANLLIATVLERHHRVSEEEQPPARGHPVLSSVAVFLAAQAAVVLGVWWTVLR